MDSLIEDLEAAEDLIVYCRHLGPLLSADLAQRHLAEISSLVANAQDKARHYAFLLASYEKETAP